MVTVLNKFDTFLETSKRHTLNDEYEVLDIDWKISLTGFMYCVAGISGNAPVAQSKEAAVAPA